MGKDTKVICDACGYDLTTTGNAVDYRLVLGNESKTPWFIAEGISGGILTDMAIPPLVERAYYFCGMPCLAKWFTGKYPSLMEDYEDLQRHQRWLTAGAPSKWDEERFRAFVESEAKRKPDG